MIKTGLFLQGTGMLLHARTCNVTYQLEPPWLPLKSIPAPIAIFASGVPMIVAQCVKGGS
jgi:hypothetical protein